MKTTFAVCAAAAAASFAAADATAASDACRATSGGTVAPVVELYTSEGCNSCPPADRWLSKLKREPDVVALAFHVDYWDRLGWRDRFASPSHTERQVAEQRVNGARFPYTPQVVVDGRDRTDWPRIVAPVATGRAAPVRIVLERDGDRVTAAVTAEAAAPGRLAGYWAVTEHGHSTSVKAGENSGATLQHDFVVVAYQPLAAWPAGGKSQAQVYTLPAGADARHARVVNLVVTDAATGKPLQALKLSC